MRAFVILLGIVVVACGGAATQVTKATAVSGSVTVFAASSLTDALTQAGEALMKRHAGTNFVFSFGSSSTLATQIANGAPAAIFASADEVNMQKIVDAKLTDGGPSFFASNRLAIAVAPGNPKKVTSLADLGRTSLVVVLAAPAVPAGRYALDSLAKAGVSVTPASQELDARSVLNKVALGEADAGIVYVTDVLSAGTRVSGVDIPEQHQVVVRYPIAGCERAKNPALAREFVAFLVSDEAHGCSQDSASLDRDPRAPSPPRHRPCGDRRGLLRSADRRPRVPRALVDRAAGALAPGGAHRASAVGRGVGGRDDPRRALWRAARLGLRARSVPWARRRASADDAPDDPAAHRGWRRAPLRIRAHRAGRSVPGRGPRSAHRVHHDGAILAAAFVATPFLVLTVEAGLRSMDRRYEDAARTLGATRWLVFRRVTLPLIAPSLFAGAVLAWARGLGEFGATITFAGNLPGTTQTLPLAVLIALETRPEVAVMLSLLLLAISLLILIALRDRYLRFN